MGRARQVEGLDNPRFTESYFHAAGTHFNRGEKLLAAGERFVDRNS